MRLSSFWVAVLAIAAPLSLLSLPATGKTSDRSPEATKPLSLSQETADFSREVRAQDRAPLQNVVVETVPVQPEPVVSKEGLLVQGPGPSSTEDSINQPVQPSTPGNGQPNQSTPAPVIRPPGTEGLPQQETPNQIQVPINPDTPSPDNNTSPPSVQPSTPPAPLPENVQPNTPPEVNDPQVLVSEVVVSSTQGQLSPELQNEVYEAIRTQPGRTATRSQLQEDINAIFATGYFSNVRAEPLDTPLGVRVTFVVQPNPVLRDVQVQANIGTNVPSVLPERIVDEIFREQYGSILNLRRFQEAVKRLNEWYQKNGYVLAQVIEAPQVAENGTVTLQVAEGVVEDIQVRFVREGEQTNDEGEPIKGSTRDFIITRELELEPGEVFNRTTVQRDLQRVYGLGLFEDVNISLNPGQDPRKVIVVMNVDERNSGSVAAGAGISSASGLFGTVSYQEQNLGGNNQKLGAELQVGQRELLFDLRFTDPWIAGDPYRTSYTTNVFRRRSISLIFDGPDDNDIEVGNDDDRPRVVRTGGGVTFSRPLSRNLFTKAEWTASAGLEYQRISIKDGDGDIDPTGEFGDEDDIPLSFSEDGTDDLLTVQLGLARDRRNDVLQPTNGSLLRFNVEQSVPVGSGSIFLNRLRGSYSQFLPVNLTKFSDGPETLAFNLQAGTVLGDLPPYEAFSLGGSNSVRGFEEGDLASGRSFIQATAEYRFPIFSAVGGVLFVDAGTDLGTGDNVPGRPAEILGKPGSGLGYGLGIRVQSPVGPLRIDYGFNTEGDNRLHFGIGQRF